MNLPTAQQTIQSLITEKQNEIDALTLALSMLESTFAPDMQAIVDAQKDADDERAQVASLEDEVQELQQPATTTPDQTPPQDATPAPDDAQPVTQEQPETA